MAMQNHKCTVFHMKGGNLVCIQCDAPSQSKKWKANVWGATKAKAMGREGDKSLTPEGDK